MHIQIEPTISILSTHCLLKPQNSIIKPPPSILMNTIFVLNGVDKLEENQKQSE